MKSNHVTVNLSFPLRFYCKIFLFLLKNCVLFANQRKRGWPALPTFPEILTTTLFVVVKKRDDGDWSRNVSSFKCELSAFPGQSHPVFRAKT